MSAARSSAFTIVEVMAVITLILVLAGLTLATSGYVQIKGARSRAEAEIAAMSAALENYQADNGIYPGSSLDPSSTSTALYQSASAILYQNLTGDHDGDGQPDSTVPSYLQFKPSQLGASSSGQFIKDPLGHSYGYSTLGPAAGGHNPTFDLWSVADGAMGTTQTKWIKNW